MTTMNDTNTDKDDAEDWEIVASYNEAIETDDGKSLVEVEVMIGHIDGRWYALTTDDAGGSDGAPEWAIATNKDDAKDWAEWFAENNDETPTAKSLIEEILALEWFDASVTEGDILSIANSIPGIGSEAYPVWISTHGGVHADHSRNTIRVEGWDDYIVVTGGADGGAEGALMEITNAIRESY